MVWGGPNDIFLGAETGGDLNPYITAAINALANPGDRRAQEAAEARERIAALAPAAPARSGSSQAVAAKGTAVHSKTPASPSAAAPKASTGKTRLQFGAFSTRERALQQRKLLESKFGQLLPGTMTVDAPVSAGKDQLYRLRSAPMSEAQARSSCTALKEQGQACVIVP